MMSPEYHSAVLREEAVQWLITDREGVYVDGTVGGGGHAELVCRQLHGAGELIGFDADSDAIEAARARLQEFEHRARLVHANFGRMKDELEALHVEHIAGLLLDLGVSSHQLKDGSRGFSFQSDERIDMRMDRRTRLTARDVVNTYEEKRLADVLWKYGEERNSRRIARTLVAGRPLETTGDVHRAIASAVGGRFLVKTMARVFQAIRIEVNQELENLQRVLEESLELLEPSGRLVVISYHSLEDRIVKDFYRKHASRRIPSGHKYLPDTEQKPKLKILTPKPVVASDYEVKQNPRARSAKMRVAERLSD
jgi:16S rRNA (cytosine1402-N4)-methyltransferase